MAEYIDKEAFLVREKKQYCSDCERRKGIKNGKRKIIYEIGEAPCRSCGINDILDDIDSFPISDDVKPVVLCRDCYWWMKQEASMQGRCSRLGMYPTGNWYCANGQKRREKS